ncbi:MAG: gluconate 2-dehydrogenase subunit 3 family protein [Bacteroidota bacterium]
MDRRTAIQNIFLLSAGAVLLPNCEMEETGPVYANVPLEKGQRTLIDLVTKAILPTEGTPVAMPEKTVDFVLTMLNDCTAPEDIQKYLLGIKEFQQGVKELYQTSFKKIDAAQQLELFTKLGESEKMTEAAKYFFNTTNGLTRWQFSTSEHFMTAYQDFEFVPGRYLGCEPV